MTMNHEEWMREMRSDNRRFAVQLVIGAVAAMAIGVAIGMWASSPTLFSAAPPVQTAPAQSLAPG